MAQESKLVFALSDISALRFTCQTEGCGAVQSFPLKTWQRIPRTCSNDTKHDWIKGGSLDEETINKFKESLQALLKYNGTAGFKIQMELDVPEQND